MINFFKGLSGPTIAVFLARTMLGLVFLMAGWWKVFTLTPAAHAQQFFIEGFKDSWIPEWLLWALGTAIPPFELTAGLLLIAGLWTRLTASLTGLLLLLTTYGHALQQPLFDIDGHTFTRLALILFVLMIPSESDRLSIDGLRRVKG
jgi:uncharacterized membrane protein YphA (DoxX/SURF4 family)